MTKFRKFLIIFLVAYQSMIIGYWVANKSIYSDCKEFGGANLVMSGAVIECKVEVLKP